MLFILFAAIAVVFLIGLLIMAKNTELGAKRTGVAMLGIAIVGGIALHAVETLRDVAVDPTIRLELGK